MSALSTRITLVTEIGDSVYVTLDDSTQMEFASRQDLIDYANDSFAVTKDTLARILVREWARRDPSLNDASNITGIEAVYEVDGIHAPVRFENV